MLERLLGIQKEGSQYIFSGACPNKNFNKFYENFTLFSFVFRSQKKDKEEEKAKVVASVLRTEFM